MKVLGISFGRKGKNCDIIAKQALFAAKDAGAEVKFVNTMDMRIDHCKGCGACSALRDKGKQIRCILKDDYLELENDVLNADAIIVVAPVYSIMPTGQLINFIGRFGAAHDLASATAEQNKRIEQGAEEMLDERIFKRPKVAYVSVGGAITENWTSLGLPNMALFGISTCMVPVGQINAYDMGRRTNPVLDPPFMDKIYDLGKHLVESQPLAPEDVTWYGEEGVCPVCHNKFISLNGTTTVDCPVCGIEGKLSIDGDKVKVEFSEAQKKRARGKIDGLWEHHYEIRSMMDVIIPKLQENKDTLPVLLKPFNEFENTYE